MSVEEWERPNVILGSGFSRSISEDMPTMAELGQQVIDRLALPQTTLMIFNNNLEQWMSFLAVDQPWLSQADNLENRAWFARASAAVQECISESEAKVIETTPLPDWLRRLVWTWCDQKANVFTFNYDTLLERALMELNRLDTFGDLYPMPLEWRVNAGDGGRFGSEGTRGEVLSLYKLHGSINWAFGGLDARPSDRILLTGDFLRWSQPPLREEPISPRERSMYDDVVPLIIPPTLTKGPYYTNLSLRGQWRRAGEALDAGGALTIIGYSFPMADLVANQWVSTSFVGHRMDIIDVVPKRPSAIRAQLPFPKKGRDVTGELAVQRYADRVSGDLVRWKIWDAHDGEGARVGLIVNGVDLLADMSLAQRPWGQDHDAAQLWLHTRIEKAEQKVIDRAIGAMDANGEDRWVVLRPGHKLKI
jgi:hypothetical protein